MNNLYSIACFELITSTFLLAKAIAFTIHSISYLSRYHTRCLLDECLGYNIRKCSSDRSLAQVIKLR